MPSGERSAAAAAAAATNDRKNNDSSSSSSSLAELAELRTAQLELERLPRSRTVYAKLGNVFYLRAKEEVLRSITETKKTREEEARERF